MLVVICTTELTSSIRNTGSIMEWLQWSESKNSTRDDNSIRRTTMKKHGNRRNGITTFSLTPILATAHCDSEGKTSPEINDFRKSNIYVLFHCQSQNEV